MLERPFTARSTYLVHPVRVIHPNTYHVLLDLSFTSRVQTMRPYELLYATFGTTFFEKTVQA